MFNKEKFGIIISKIKETYDSQEVFSQLSGIGRTSISLYMNNRLDEPPKPQMLKKLADSSKGLATYEELMEICGYTKRLLHNSLLDTTSYRAIPIFKNIDEIMDFDNLKDHENILEAFKYIYYPVSSKEDIYNYFAFSPNDSSMAPLLDKDDIAIIFRQENYEFGRTYLILLDGNLLLIRKILKSADALELHAMNPYFPIIKLSKDDITEKSFTILGKVIKVENKSAFI